MIGLILSKLTPSTAKFARDYLKLIQLYLRAGQRVHQDSCKSIDVLARPVYQQRIRVHKLIIAKSKSLATKLPRDCLTLIQLYLEASQLIREGSRKSTEVLVRPTYQQRIYVVELIMAKSKLFVLDFPRDCWKLIQLHLGATRFRRQDSQISTY